MAQPISPTPMGTSSDSAASSVVLSQVQTNNDPSWVKTCHAPITGTTSFRLAFEKEEAGTVAHGIETIGWLAVQPGSGTWDGRAYVAGRTPNAVTDAPYTISFGASHPSPRVFAAMSTYDGGDCASVRYVTLTSSSVSVFIEEDNTFDAELAHTSEVVDFLVISGDGVLEGHPQ